jgi:hypothetical protein
MSRGPSCHCRWGLSKQRWLAGATIVYWCTSRFWCLSRPKRRNLLPLFSDHKIPAEFNRGIQRQHVSRPLFNCSFSSFGRAIISSLRCSPDGGATWNAYIAETEDVETEFPVFTSILVNEPSQPMQANVNNKWDQGYLIPFWDLNEYFGL